MHPAKHLYQTLDQWRRDACRHCPARPDIGRGGWFAIGLVIGLPIGAFLFVETVTYLMP